MCIIYRRQVKMCSFLHYACQNTSSNFSILRIRLLTDALQYSSIVKCRNTLMLWLHRYFSNFHVSWVTQLCATKWRTRLGVLRKYIIKTKGIQLHRSRPCKYLTLKSEIVVMASTGILRNRTRYDCKHVQGGVGLNYRDCEFRYEKLSVITMR